MNSNHSDPPFRHAVSQQYQRIVKAQQALIEFGHIGQAADLRTKLRNLHNLQLVAGADNADIQTIEGCISFVENNHQLNEELERFLQGQVETMSRALRAQVISDIDKVKALKRNQGSLSTNQLHETVTNIENNYRVPALQLNSNLFSPLGSALTTLNVNHNNDVTQQSNSNATMPSNQFNLNNRGLPGGLNCTQSNNSLAMLLRNVQPNIIAAANEDDNTRIGNFNNRNDSSHFDLLSLCDFRVQDTPQVFAGRQSQQQEAVSTSASSFSAPASILLETQRLPFASATTSVQQAQQGRPDAQDEELGSEDGYDDSEEDQELAAHFIAAAAAAIAAYENYNEPPQAQDDAAWNEHFYALCKYIVEHKHPRVPCRYAKNKKLGNWVMTQRLQYRLMKEGKKDSLTLNRIAKLNSVGFAWVVRDGSKSWSDRFEELKAFKLENGHCSVPQKYVANPQLGTWVHTQRRQYKMKRDGKKASISPKRIEALDSIGFVWIAK